MRRNLRNVCGVRGRVLVLWLLIRVVAASHTLGMKTPLDRLDTVALRRVYWLFLLLTALVPIGMGELAKFVPEGAAAGTPYRTVPTYRFEFANAPAKWEALAADVGAVGLDALRRQTYLDMLFAVCYSTATAACVVGIARGASSRAVLACAPWVAWGSWLAGALDMIENTGMLLNIAGPLSPVWLQATAACAAVKFGLVGVGVLFVFFLLPLPWREGAR